MPPCRQTVRLAVACARAAVALGLLALAGCAPAPRMAHEWDASAAGDIRPGAVWAVAAFLADPAREGRMAGTRGNREAGEYLASQFARAGLAPGGDGGTWFQAFPAPPIHTPGTRSGLAFDEKAMALHEDFSPMAAGRPGQFAGRLVFAGYGRRAPLGGYDDYKGLDARGAVVMILRGTEAGSGPKSIWAVKGATLRRPVLTGKLRRAAKAGAVAVLLVSPANVGGRADPLYSVLGDAHGALPAMRISRAAADRMLRAARGPWTSLASLEGRLRRTRKPASFATDLRVTGRADLAPGLGRNVIGIRPATDPHPGRTIVIGAHYDHLSACGLGAKDSGIGIRPGADDNASGVAAMVLLARALARRPHRTFTYVFVAFDAEEYGFLGSKHYVARPAAPIKRTALMVNIDQIGRYGANGLTVIGAGGREPYRSALRWARPADGFKTIPWTSKRRWSDQAAFAAKGVDTLFFFTGLHKDYHRTTDTLARLDIPGTATVAAVVLGTLTYLEETASP